MQWRSETNCSPLLFATTTACGSSKSMICFRHSAGRFSGSKSTLRLPTRSIGDLSKHSGKVMSGTVKPTGCSQQPTRSQDFLQTPCAPCRLRAGNRNTLSGSPEPWHLVRFRNPAWWQMKIIRKPDGRFCASVALALGPQAMC